MFERLFGRPDRVVRDVSCYELARFERQFLAGVTSHDRRNMDFICVKAQVNEMLAYEPKPKPGFLWSQAGYKKGFESRGPEWLTREWDKHEGAVVVKVHPPHNLWGPIGDYLLATRPFYLTCRFVSSEGRTGTAVIHLVGRLTRICVFGFRRDEVGGEYPDSGDVHVDCVNVSDDWSRWEKLRDGASSKLRTLATCILETMERGCFSGDRLIPASHGYVGPIRGVRPTGAYGELMASSNGMTVNTLKLYSADDFYIGPRDVGGRQAFGIGNVGDLWYFVGVDGTETTNQVYYSGGHGAKLKRFNGDVFDLCLSKLKGEAGKP